LSGLTASCHRQKEVLYYEELSSAAKGKRVGGRLIQHGREKGFHSCHKRQFKCKKQICMQDKPSSNEMQPHTQYTPNEACTETFIHELCHLLVKPLGACEKVTQLGGTTRPRCLERGLSHLPI